jgi:hypothetical protein
MPLLFFVSINNTFLGVGGIFEWFFLQLELRESGENLIGHNKCLLSLRLFLYLHRPKKRYLVVVIP